MLAWYGLLFSCASSLWANTNPPQVNMKPDRAPLFKDIVPLLFKTIVSCCELWLWGKTVDTWVAALKMAVNGIFEYFHVLKCIFIRNEGVLQNVLICVLEPLLAGPPYSPFIDMG